MLATQGSFDQRSEGRKKEEFQNSMAATKFRSTDQNFLHIHTMTSRACLSIAESGETNVRSPNENGHSNASEAVSIDGGSDSPATTSLSYPNSQSSKMLTSTTHASSTTASNAWTQLRKHTAVASAKFLKGASTFMDLIVPLLSMFISSQPLRNNKSEV